MTPLHPNRTGVVRGRRGLVVAVLCLVLSVVGPFAPRGLLPPGALSGTAAAATVPPPTRTAIAPALLAGIDADDLPVGCTVPNRHLTLYAVQLPSVDGAVRLGYGVTPESASYPGPTIEAIEGECLAITLVNDVPAETLAVLREQHQLRLPVDRRDPDMPLGVSLHVHGVKYTAASDGTLHTGSWVPPGQARTYVWYAEPRSLAPDGRVLSHGTAGYWWYHDHVVGTHHGTGGVGAGLFGALVVRRPGDPVPDRTYVVGMGDNASINLRNGPAIHNCAEPAQPSPTCFVAVEGERVELVVIGLGDDFHTFHLHGHTWVDNRHGVLTPTDEATRVVDVVPLGPSSSFGFSVVAGASVGAGDWMLHCHVQRHSDLGMVTHLHVLPKGTPVDEGGAAAGVRFRGSAEQGAESVPAGGGPDALVAYCLLPARRPAPPQA